jgi:hypothetical protein
MSLVAIGALALLAVGAAAYVHSTRPTKSTAKTVTPTETPASSVDQGANHPGQGSAGGSSTATTPSSSTSTSPTTDPKYNSTTLTPPVQTFNKSHTPVSLSQTDSTQSDFPSLDSTCKTVEGATCEIHAALGSTTKVVAGPTTVADAVNGLDFQWNAKTGGLSVGTWTITAVAKKDGQTTTSTATTLEVRS